MDGGSRTGLGIPAANDGCLRHISMIELRHTFDYRYTVEPPTYLKESCQSATFLQLHHLIDTLDPLLMSFQLRGVELTMVGPESPGGEVFPSSDLFGAS